MGNNGLIDPKHSFSPAYCFSWPIQCPAAVPAAFRFSSTIKTTTVYQQQSCPGKAAGGGCQSAPCSGASLLLACASLLLACASQRCQRRPDQAMLMASTQARREALCTRQSSKDKTEAVDDLGAQSQKFLMNLNQSHQKCLTGTKASVEIWSMNRSQNCALKPEALVELGI